MTEHTIFESPLGPVTLVADDGALSGVYFPGHWTRPSRASFGARNDGAFDEARRQLTEYLDGARTSFDLPTASVGDDFQQRVWGLIDEIPYGHTTTYGDLARSLGDVRLAHDVGAAVGQNPLSLIRPCHRVVGKNGALTGYAGGLERKRSLLALEGVPLDQGALQLF